MQKKLIALAVAAVAAGSVFAQTNVTIYGVADAYLGRFASDANRTSYKVNSGGLGASRLGFKGVEDLGNGLKALFTLEYRLDIDGNNALGTNTGVSGPARQQFVGLTGGFGTVVAGRLQTTGYDWAVSYDLLAGTAISPLQNVNGADFKIGGTAAHARADNAIAYISPSFSGLTLAANYALAAEESAAKTAESNRVSATLLSANYANGPLAVGLVYDVQAGNTLVSSRDIALGGKYNAGVATFSATYQTTKATNDATGIAADTNKAYSLGVAVPVSAAGTVLASYAKNTIASTAAADDKKSYTVAYTQGLSKRTTAYAGFTATKSDVANSDSNALVAGVNHKF